MNLVRLREIDRCLFFACICGDLESVKRYLDDGAQIKVKDTEGATSLHWASRNGHTAVVKLLLVKDADIEAEDDKGKRALHWASEHGCVEVVELLLDRGAQIEAKDNGGAPALHYAIEYGHTTVVELLLVKDAQIGAANDAGLRAKDWLFYFTSLVDEVLANGAQNSFDSCGADTSEILDYSQEPSDFTVLSFDFEDLSTPFTVNDIVALSPSTHNPSRTNHEEITPTPGSPRELQVAVPTSPCDTQFSENSSQSSFTSIPSLNPSYIAFSDLKMEKKLGSGGLGEVYRANLTATSQLVAVKILKRRANAESALKREWEALCIASHPNIIEVLHLVKDERHLGYTMELMDESLRDRMLREKMTPRIALYISMEVAKGLQYMHDHGMAHNDVKPHNVLLRETQDKLEVKLCDFGAVSKYRTVARTVTHHQWTPDYAAPERRPGGQYSTAADAYSFGVMLEEMLDGEISEPLRMTIDKCRSENQDERPTLVEICSTLEETYCVVMQSLQVLLHRPSILLNYFRRNHFSNLLIFAGIVAVLETQPSVTNATESKVTSRSIFRRILQSCREKLLYSDPRSSMQPWTRRGIE